MCKKTGLLQLFALTYIYFTLTAVIAEVWEQQKKAVEASPPLYFQRKLKRSTYKVAVIACYHIKNMGILIARVQPFQSLENI